jgi:hypothetical protein
MRYKAVAAFLFAGTLAFLAPRPASAAWSVSISYFHQELAPYGRWVSTAAYGEVWCPTVVAAGWQPYLDGEWAYTDYGWTWVSYDPFGPDPFHYGTWVWIDSCGWSWVPGFVWGPAWVTWAYTDSYIGWACLPPSFDITVAGYAGRPIVVPQNQYIFVAVNSFVGTTVSSVRVPVQQNAGILTRAHKVTRFSVSGGIVRASDPPPSFVQRVTGKTLHRTSLSSQKLRVTTIAAAGVVSRKRVRIVAPAHVRAVAATREKPSNPKVARRAAPSGKSTREATARSALTSRRPTRAVKEKPSGGKPAGAEKAMKAPREAPSAHAKAATAPQRSPREVQGREFTTSRPHASVEKRSSAATGPAPKEIRRERAPSAIAPRAVERRSENPPSAIKHEKGPAPAARSEASQAHPAPAAVAKPREQPPAQPRPQPQGPPAGRKDKEKEKG